MPVVVKVRENSAVAFGRVTRVAKRFQPTVVNGSQNPFLLKKKKQKEICTNSGEPIRVPSRELRSRIVFQALVIQ